MPKYEITLEQCFTTVVLYNSEAKQNVRSLFKMNEVFPSHSMLWFIISTWNGNLSNCEWFCLEASSAYFIYGCCKNYIKWWVTVADEHWNNKRPQTSFNESPVPKALCTAASQLNLGFSNFSSSFQSNPIWTVRNIRNWKKGEKKWTQIDLSTWIFCCVRGLS